MITAEGIEGAAYVGDYQPVNLYAGAHKVAGWHSQTVSGEGTVSLDGAYNVPPDALVIDGKCTQTVGVWGTNLITNGDFSNGTTGWQAFLSTISESSGRLSLTATRKFGKARTDISPTTIGHLYYTRAKVNVPTANVYYFGIQNLESYISQTGESSISEVRTATAATGTRVDFGDGRDSGWQTAYLDNVLCIDLTAAFGAGNEPTAEEMDTYLAAYPDSWFDGSALITTDGTPNSPSPAYPAPINAIEELTLRVSGKNLIKTKDITTRLSNGVTFTKNADGSFTANGTATSNWIAMYADFYDMHLIPGETYTLSGRNSNFYAQLSFYREDGTKVGQFYVTDEQVRTFVCPEHYFVRSAVMTGSTSVQTEYNNVTIYPQLELGSTATAYEPPTGYTEVPLPLNGEFIGSLPDGTKDEYDAVTGIITKRCGKYVGTSGISWTISDAADNSSFISDKIQAGTLSGKVLTAPSTCAPTVYYALATPYTIQLTPDLPVIRTGIKTLTVGANITPTFTATVKAMD